MLISIRFKNIAKLLLVPYFCLLLNCNSLREASCKNEEGSVLQACLFQRTDRSGATQVYAPEICLVEINDYLKCKKKQ